MVVAEAEEAVVPPIYRVLPMLPSIPLVMDNFFNITMLAVNGENVSAATVVGAASSFATKVSTATTATAGQTVFNGTYTVGFVDVYLNGSKLSEDQYTASSGTNIALDTGARR